MGTDLNRNFGYHWGGGFVQLISEYSILYTRLLVQQKTNCINIVVTACSSGKQCSILFRGPTPESELETKAIEKTVKALSSSLMVFLTVHSYSQLWMTGWSYTEERSDIHDEEVKNITGFHQMF